ncbi:hypothetical protein ACWOC1_03515 [Enterococcus quebecensis]|uniref:Uncharacterized protein n=1 Tax=Enterococcus quebecensis TaxID=903983 RepID=A0A1E5GR47_9ENTE|nr:hypothetical protein [Enterococcus quebecensis]OEG15152.1 hypothetical protein BCR23_09955 [Enterococcus quebecensis]OJG74728.1 hypothetical protein RV12_GL002145 [Enterococcus quebecensis]
MQIKLEVLITENKTTIQFDNTQGTINIVNTNDRKVIVEKPSIYFLLKNNTIIAIEKTETNSSYEDIDFNKVITITPPWDVELGYLEQLFIADATESGIKLVNTSQEDTKIPVNYEKTVTDYKDQVLLVLENFGYHLKHHEEPKKAKAKPAKARHKWTKEISQIEFFIDTRESKATALWYKRNEMLLKAGATMMANPPLNKDGSLGFSAKMGERIRQDHKDQIKNNVTTEDIILKSVNEVGLFLYFGGTNSWLELIDANGKTLNEWTVVQ